MTCLSVGSTSVTLEVGNRESASLPNPVVAVSTVEVECGVPDRLELHPELPTPVGTTQNCPLAARTGRVPVLSYEDLSIRVKVFDAQGRKFDNVSSAALSWNLDDGSNGDGTGARLAMDKGVMYPGSKHPTLGFRLAEDPVQTLIVGDARKSGPAEVIHCCILHF